MENEISEFRTVVSQEDKSVKMMNTEKEDVEIKLLTSKAKNVNLCDSMELTNSYHACIISLMGEEKCLKKLTTTQLFLIKIRNYINR